MKKEDYLIDHVFQKRKSFISSDITILCIQTFSIIEFDKGCRHSDKSVTKNKSVSNFITITVNVQKNFN